jgi:hypothetical protein
MADVAGGKGGIFDTAFKQKLLMGGLGMGAAGGAMGIGNALFGGSQPGKVMSANRYNQQGQNVLSSLMTQGLQNADFSNIANQARGQFYGSTVPTIAERFSNMGGEGGQRSSAFAGTVGAAGAGLESQLAAMQSQFGMQQLVMGLTPQLENFYQPRQAGFAESFGSSLMALLPMLLGMPPAI